MSNILILFTSVQQLEWRLNVLVHLQLALLDGCWSWIVVVVNMVSFCIANCQFLTFQFFHLVSMAPEGASFRIGVDGSFWGPCDFGIVFRCLFFG